MGFRSPRSGLQQVGIASAFQPLSDERNTRLTSTLSSTNSDRQPNSSRTSGLFSQRVSVSEHRRRLRAETRSMTNEELTRMEREAARNLETLSRTSTAAPNLMTTSAATDFSPPLPTDPPPANPPPPPVPAPPVRNTATHNIWAYSTSLIDPLHPAEEAQTITESIGLIRDILRDSGTRLLNLITNMSMDILSNSERDASARVPVHVFTGNLRRDLMASSSDSDTENPEVNITRTPNTTFRGWDNELIELNSISDDNFFSRLRRNSTGPQISDRMTFETEPESESPSRQGGINVSNRMTFELDNASEVPSREGGINVSLSDDRFRVRSQGSWAMNSSPHPTRADSPRPAPSDRAASTVPQMGPPSEAAPSARDEPQPGPSSAPDGPDAPDPNQPSTSRGYARPRSSDIAAQAFRRVKMGVYTLQKHTLTLANMWLRGDLTTCRELRILWEELRRRIQALPNFYNRSLLERCMLLSELRVMPELPTRPRTSARGRPSSRRSLRVRIQNRARSEETIRMRYERDRNPNEAENGVARSNANASDSQSKSKSPTTSKSNIPRTSNSNTPSTSNANTPSTSITTTATLSSNTPDISNSTTAGTSNSNNPTTSNSNNPSTSRNATAGPSTSTENTNDNRSSRAARAQRIQRNRVQRLQQRYRWRADESRRADIFLPFRLSRLRPRTRSNLIRSLEQNATRHVIRTRAMKILSVMFNMMMMCLEERGLNQLIINMLKTLKKALALTCFMMMSNRNMPRDRPRDAPADQNTESADVVRIQNVDHSGPINVDDNVDDPHSLRLIRCDAVTSSTQTENIYPIKPLPSPQTSPTTDSRVEMNNRLAVQIAAANRNTSSTAKRRRDVYLETRRQKALHRTNPKKHPYIRRRFPITPHWIPALRTLPPELLYNNRLTPRSPPADPVAGPSNAWPGNRPEQPILGREVRENFLRLAHLRLRSAARTRFRRLQTIRLSTIPSARDMFGLEDFPGENRTEDVDELEDLGSGRLQFNAMLASEGLLQVNDLPPAAEANMRLARIHEYLQPIILAQV